MRLLEPPLLGGIVVALAVITSALLRIAKRLNEWHLERMEARHEQELAELASTVPHFDDDDVYTGGPKRTGVLKRQAEEYRAAGGVFGGD